MNPKTTLTLVIVLALAGSVLFLTSQGRQATTDTEGPTKESVGIIDSNLLGPSLSQITFYSGNFIPIQLERIAGEWFVTSPHRFPANSAAIDQALTRIAELKATPLEREAELILDGSGITLHNNGKEIHLSLGERLGAGKAVLTLWDGDQSQLYVVNDKLHELHADAFELKGHHPYYKNRPHPLLMPDYGRIEIETVESSSVLRQVDQNWVIGEDESAERALETRIGDHPGIADYFKLFESLEIDQFVDYFGEEDAAKYGLTQPLITVRFVPLGADPKRTNAGMTLRIGSPADLADQTRYCSYGRSNTPYPIAFTIPTPIALAFGQSAERFRDPRLTTLAKPLIRTIQVEQHGQRGVIVSINLNREDTLAAIEPELGNYPVNISLQGSEMLALLLDERAKEYLEVERESLKQIATITLDAPFEQKTESLQIYEELDAAIRKASVLVRRGKENTLLRIERPAIDRLLRLPEQLNIK